MCKLRPGWYYSTAMCLSVSSSISQTSLSGAPRALIQILPDTDAAQQEVLGRWDTWGPAHRVCQPTGFVSGEPDTSLITNSQFGLSCAHRSGNSVSQPSLSHQVHCGIILAVVCRAEHRADSAPRSHSLFSPPSTDK